MKTIGGVIALAVVCGIAFILLAILGLTGILAFMSAGVNILVVVVYLVASQKLKVAVGGGKNKTAKRVIALTIKLAVALLFVIVSSGIFTLVDVLQVGMLMANLLMPAGFAAFHLLICHFIKSSNDRKRRGVSPGGTTVGSTQGGTQGNGATARTEVTIKAR